LTFWKTTISIRGGLGADGLGMSDSRWLAKRLSTTARQSGDMKGWPSHVLLVSEPGNPGLEEGLPAEDLLGHVDHAASRDGGRRGLVQQVHFEQDAHVRGTV
jgi:hypothetical protein